MILKICGLILVLFAASCSIVTVERYVHEDTADILNTFYWTTEKRTLDELVSADLETPIIVPDFRGSGSGTLILRVITRSYAQVYIDRFSISSEETGELVERTVSRVPSPKETTQGLWVATVTLSIEQSNAFVNADKVNLSVVWSDGSTESNTESTFELIRTRRKDVAWVT